MPDIPEKHFAVGKVPWEDLAPVLSAARRVDSGLMVGPGRGLDAAALRVGGRILVTATDPITFATEEVGTYAVTVNANDVAAMGVRPRWFQAVVLLPEHTAAPTLAETVFGQMIAALDEYGAVLAGGHTEVTAGLSRVVIAGQMMGITDPEKLIRPSGGRPGDALLLAGSVGVEATALLAMELPDRLAAAGLRPADIERAAAYLRDPGLSIVRAAMAAAATSAVTAMHDVTEGGVATAVDELASACSAGVEVTIEKLPVTPLTRRVCEAVAIDPMGAIGSGGLLISTRPDAAETVRWAVRLLGFPCERIGTLTGRADERVAVGPDGPEPLRRFEVDEVARVLSDGQRQKL